MGPALPEEERDDQRRQEVHGVEEVEVEVVPLHVAVPHDRLQSFGRQFSAADPLVEPGHQHVVDVRIEVVGEAARERIEDEQSNKWRQMLSKRPELAQACAQEQGQDQHRVRRPHRVVGHGQRQKRKSQDVPYGVRPYPSHPAIDRHSAILGLVAECSRILRPEFA
jgi:hypothetical protein